MQSDEAIWQCCGKSFCSFKVQFKNVALCRNMYNVTGECSRSTCPLANSFYGTILEEDGRCFLLVKTIERAHTPRKLWEKIELPQDETAAMDMIEAKMKNIYKEYQIRRCKARLAKAREYLSRVTRLAGMDQPQISYESRKLQRREASREVKALRTAAISTAVEEELVARLRAGQYDTIYNLPFREFDCLLEREGEVESDGDCVDSEEQENTLEFEEDIEDVVAV